jgi:hypothetical protein
MATMRCSRHRQLEERENDTQVAARHAQQPRPAAAMQKTRKRAVDGEPNVMENLDQITTNKSLVSKSPATKLARTNGTPPSAPHGFLARLCRRVEFFLPPVALQTVSMARWSLVRR